MSSQEHLARTVVLAGGRWGVFRIDGCVVVARVTLSNVKDLIIAVEPRAGSNGTRARTEQQCRDICLSICDRIKELSCPS